MKPIGIIGGTGFDRFVKNGSSSREVSTNYGSPSSPVFSLGIGNREVKFIYRHGRSDGKRIPPQFVNYAANMKALSDEGCENILVTTAVGDLILPENVGKLAIPHQLINYTEGRRRTLYDNRIVHVEFADPYCGRLRQMMVKKGHELEISMLDDGIVAVVSGNNFSTRAEHSRFKKDGCTIVGMTQYPESVFARELGLCYVAVAIVTDYAINLQSPPDIRETTHEEVVNKFAVSVGNVTHLLEELVPQIPDERNCPCSTALKRAIY